MRWLDAMADIPQLDTRAQQRTFLLNLICFAACVEGLFFFGAFAYVYVLRSRGLWHGLAAGTSWVFRDDQADAGERARFFAGEATFCAQRAFSPVGHALVISEHESALDPYTFAERPGFRPSGPGS